MMAKVVAFLLALLVAPAASLKVDFSDSAWKEKPIQKVVRLLKEMQGQIEKEAAEDEELYEKMGCWCETNDREKTKALEDAEQRITDLTAAIPEYAAKAATLEVDIAHLKKQNAENEKALATAIEVRAKEQEEFRTSEKEMIQSAASLKNAVQVMSKVHKDALPQESLLQVQNTLRHHFEQHSSMFPESLSRNQHELLLSFVQGPVSMIQQKSSTKNKQPASGAIFGILKQMKEDFEKNLETSAADEKEAVAEFKDMKAAKQKEIKAGEDLVDTKTIEMADAIEKNAVSKQDLEDTNAQKKADTEFLQNLKLKCQNADHEFEQRQKTRNEEIKSVSETISILTDDDNADTMRKATFFQVSRSTLRTSTADKVATSLRKAGKKFRDPRLMAVSMSMRLDAFAAVKENIDKTIKALKEEQKEEVKQKDNCVASLNENEMQSAAKSDLSDDLKQKGEDLATTIEELTAELETLKAEIADMKTEIKRASENREKQNHEFQTTVSEQRATQAILKKAMDKLKSFYAALVQEHDSDDQDQPEQKEYKKNAGASGVMMMIETIIDESKQTETEATQGESDSQAAYESFVKDSNASLEAAAKDVANKSEELAKADVAKVTAEDDLKATIDDMLTLGEMGQELHKSCDFLIKNFDLRQTSRSEEIEALVSAKAIFSGVSM